MGSIRFVCALIASVVCALALVHSARSSVLNFSPGSTKVSNGMVYRLSDYHNDQRLKRQADFLEKVDLNALIPGVQVLSRYEEDNACRCLPFYNCCNESATAGLCGEALDIRSNLDFTENHCKVDYHECCDINVLCGEDVACLTRLAIVAQPSPPTPVDQVPTVLPTEPTVPYATDKSSSEEDEPPASTSNTPISTPSSFEPPLPPIDSIVTTPPPVTPQTRDPPPARTQCGVRNFDGVGVRLAGSAEVKRTQYGEVPWMAALLRVDAIGRQTPADIYVGGGVLISPSIVLTAAHSVADYAKGDFHNLKVRLGEWDAMSDQEPYLQEDYKLRYIILHPEFNPRIVLNDVAVLVLERPVEMHQHIAPVCLPEDSESEIYQDNVQGCLVTGWGKDSFFGQYQNVLKLIEVPTVRKEKCEEKMRATRLGTAFRLHPSFICAGGDGIDACKGDGGSPLVCPSVHAGKDPQDVRYVLTGLVSWGIGCAEVQPGVYANIPHLLPWIRGFVKEHDPDYHYSSIN